jgi:hypothetical protein
MSDKVILTVATTGAVTPKELNPNVPITLKEIAEDAYKCWKAGASVVHLHMRDDQGLGTMDKHKFKETIIPTLFVSLHNHGEQTPSFAHLCSMLANQAFLFAIVIGLIGLAFVF